MNKIILFSHLILLGLTASVARSNDFSTTTGIGFGKVTSESKTETETVSSEFKYGGLLVGMKWNRDLSTFFQRNFHIQFLINGGELFREDYGLGGSINLLGGPAQLIRQRKYISETISHNYNLNIEGKINFQRYHVPPAPDQENNIEFSQIQTQLGISFQYAPLQNYLVGLHAYKAIFNSPTSERKVSALGAEILGEIRFLF